MRWKSYARTPLALKIQTHLSPGLWSDGAERWAWTPLCSAGRCHSWSSVWSPLTCWPGTEPASPYRLSCFAAGLSGCSPARCCSLGCTAAIGQRGTDTGLERTGNTFSGVKLTETCCLPSMWSFKPCHNRVNVCLCVCSAPRYSKGSLHWLYFTWCFSLTVKKKMN